MKKYFTYIATVLALAACSSEDSVTGNATGMENVDETSGIIKVKIEPPVGVGDADVTRSSLTYNDNEKVMDLKWDDDDCIGVFTLGEPEHSSQQRYTQVIGDKSNTDLERIFKTPDDKLSVDAEKQYVACFPYFAGHPLNYTNIEVDYSGQTQAANVDFTNYYTVGTSDEAYRESQKKASAHLGKYDFLCTGPTMSTEGGGIYFKLNRMGAIVRFWIVLPDKGYSYDELQLVNNSKAFTVTATMNAEAKTLTPVSTSNKVTLKLGADGLRLSEGYLMAYMMMAPIDLSGADTEKCTLYLVAHDSDDNMHYFKSPGLSKPNLTPNKFYKWTVHPEEEKPIAFDEITVQDWQEGTALTNGEGTGTETW